MRGNEMKTTCIAVVFLAMIFSLCQSKNMTNSFSSEDKHMTTQEFGKLPDGRPVTLYTLTNSAGVSVNIITYGATVTGMMVPDKNGKLEDVILGYDSIQGYIHDRSYFGVIAGRYGNRIGKGKFSIDGKEYQVTVNDGENHLHGGRFGFNKKLWTAKVLSDKAEPSLEMTLVSPDGEEGYPGTVTLTVVYTLTAKNELKIDYTGTTDKPTVLNPTNHSYFNLSGSFNNTILDHLLTLESDTMTPVAKGLITTGEMVSVANTPMDFRTPTAISTHINDQNDQLKLGGGYDHNWVIRNYDKKVRKAAELYEPKSGRLMTMFTDQPGVQFYSGNFLNGSAKGKGVAYKLRTGLCLEAQGYPDTPNKPQWPSVTLRPGEVYHQTTIYQFSTK
jgi:aldose 1-epimerase